LQSSKRLASEMLVVHDITVLHVCLFLCPFHNSTIYSVFRTPQFHLELHSCEEK